MDHKTEIFLKKLHDKWNGEYELIGEYYGVQTKIDVRHSQCGMITNISPSNLLNQKIPCKYCNPNSHKDTQIYEYQLHKKFGNEYDVIGEYKGADKPIDLRHNSCGHKITIQNASSGLNQPINCPFCHPQSKLQNTESFAFRMDKIYGDEYSIIGAYTTARETITVRHNMCGLIYDPHPNEILRGRELCPRCTDRSGYMNTDIAKTIIDDLYDGKFTLLDEYKTVNDTNQFLCSDCNEQVLIRMDTMLKGNGICPKCGTGTSYPEKVFMSLFDQLGVSYIFQLTSKKFLWCKPYRYDFYLPDLNWIVEVHGLQHYQDSWQTLEKTQLNDQNKMILALNNGIDKYIVIDARYSQIDYIQASIRNSELNLLDLSKVDWSKCAKDAVLSSNMRIVELWEQGYEMKEIPDMLHVSIAQVWRVIHEFDISGSLKRSVKENARNHRSELTRLRNNKKVKCIETGIVYNSAKEAELALFPDKLPRENISHCASKAGHQNTAYGFHWEYIEQKAS